jgi:hypothetical protein
VVILNKRGKSMPGMIDRIIGLLQERREDNALQTNFRFFNEINSISIVLTHRFLAVAEYVETGDPERFRENMRQSVNYLIQLYEKYGAGEKVSQSYLDEDSFVYLWNSLAAGDWDLSEKLMKYIYKYNPDMNHPNPWGRGYKINHFDRGFNYMLQVVMLGMDLGEDIFQKTHDVFAKRHKSYVGYIKAFEAIYKKDKQQFEEAFKIIMKGHNILCRTGCEFGNSVDEVVAVWPLAMVNLARMKGVDVQIQHPLIPQDLIVKLGR